jgi:GntR family transcriptional regulator, rspAB operon transcriptional repressor
MSLQTLTSEETHVPPRLVRIDVYERIRGEILSCALRPGTRLQEKELAEKYGVSKSPVRDALLRLQEQHLIEVLPRKGYRVTPISMTAIREMYEMRALLECACVRRLIDHAGDAELAALDALAAAPRDTGVAAWIQYNSRFHLALARTCGNSRLARATGELIEQFDRLITMNMNNVLREAGNLQPFVDEHTAIVAAIRRRDKRAAIALTRAHVESSQELLLEQVGALAVVP